MSLTAANTRPATAVYVAGPHMVAWGDIAKEKRLSLPCYESVDRPMSAKLVIKANSNNNDSPIGYTQISSDGKLRNRESIKSTGARINIKFLKAKAPFNVSNGQASSDISSSSISYPGKKSRNSTILRTQSRRVLLKKPTMENTSKVCTSFFRKIFSTSKGNRKKIQPTVATLDLGQKHRVAAGTGSQLSDLQHYLGNESFKICRDLCRLQKDSDDKSFYIPSSRIGSLPFNVRQFDAEDAPHVLLLPATIFEDLADDAEKEMMKLFMENFISMLPAGCEKISRKANPAGLVLRLLPAPVIPSGARFLGAAFWLWLCAVDDQIENMNEVNFDKAIKEIKCVFDGEVPADPDSRVAQTSFALKDLVARTDLNSTPDGQIDGIVGSCWRQCFLDAVMEILRAFEGERPLLDQFSKGEKHVKLTDWMVLRLVTISARPFMVLARASLGLQPSLSSAGNTANIQTSTVPHRRGRSDSAQTFTPDLEWEEDISRLEVLAQFAMGLQNDILGWEKDHAEKNILNSVEILFQIYQHRQTAMREMVLIHNHAVNQLCLLADIMISKYTPEPMSSTVSPTRTLFRMDTILSPRSFPPLITSPISPAGPASPVDKIFKAHGRKAGMHLEDELTKEAKYVTILLSFVQGMAIWTSKAKRYAV